MKTLNKIISIFLILAGLAIMQSISALAADTNAPAVKFWLPAELEDILQNADEFTLFSLEPAPDSEHKSINTFQGHAILGQTKIKLPTTWTTLIKALNDGIGAKTQETPPGVVTLFNCFNPRHGIRAKKGDETVEFLICFECEQIQVHSNKGKSWALYTTHEPASVFNDVLMKNHIPLPKD